MKIFCEDIPDRFKPFILSDDDHSHMCVALELHDNAHSCVQLAWLFGQSKVPVVSVNYYGLKYQASKDCLMSYFNSSMKEQGYTIISDEWETTMYFKQPE